MHHIPSLPSSSFFFTFFINNYLTFRQNGQILNLEISYKFNLIDNFDYELARADAIAIIEDYKKNPNEYWGFVAKKIADTLYLKYKLLGIIVKIRVESNEKPDAFEPGIHGPTYLLGDMQGFNY
jgi:hypothetical protein